MVKRPAKVFRSGSNGLVVTLPADWVRGLGLMPGTLLEIEYSDDEMIVRIPPRSPPPNLMVEAAKKMVKAARV